MEVSAGPCDEGDECEIRECCQERPQDVEGAEGETPGGPDEGFLSEDKLIEVYDRPGNILHAENPLGNETDHRFFIEAVPGWLSEVMNLLECQKVYLYHRSVKGAVIMDRRGVGERSGVALQNWTTRRLP